jgi:hypothetical protein
VVTNHQFAGATTIAQQTFYRSVLGALIVVAMRLSSFKAQAAGKITQL